MNGPAIPGGKVLFIDDERRILDAFERQFRKRFAIETADSPQQGLLLLAGRGPYSVIVSDLRMPGMTGIDVLAEAKRISPDSVRILLTGHADTNAAVSAINDGNIFRFLMKPCVGEVLAKTIEDALEQHRLITSERLLLERTLRGAIEVLTEMLGLLSPAVFSQASRIRDVVRHAAERLLCPETWRFEVAAMLSHIGCITVAPEIVGKVSQGESLTDEEKRRFETHPSVGARLLVKIPRLGEVACMIARQLELCTNPDETLTGDDVLAGARLLRAAIDLDHLHVRGSTHAEALATLHDRGGYNGPVLAALADSYRHTASTNRMDVGVGDLVPGMIADQDVITPAGVLLLARGQHVTEHVVARLECFRSTQGVIEPFRVRMPG
jgi:response regulator RpfG family c-di-GMP phosphodiesterase